jgi:hypothetical protein
MAHETGRFVRLLFTIQNAPGSEGQGSEMQKLRFSLSGISNIAVS